MSPSVIRLKIKNYHQIHGIFLNFKANLTNQNFDLGKFNFLNVLKSRFPRLYSLTSSSGKVLSEVGQWKIREGAEIFEWKLLSRRELFEWEKELK